MHRERVVASRVPARTGFLIMILCFFLALSSAFSEEKEPSFQHVLERAKQGEAKAQFNLGVMYAMGYGVPQDYVQAHKWFNLAASRFSASEAENRDRTAQARDYIATRMTPAQVAEAQRLAREWQPKK